MIEASLDQKLNSHVLIRSTLLNIYLHELLATSASHTLLTVGYSCNCSRSRSNWNAHTEYSISIVGSAVIGRSADMREASDPPCMALS